tara:strand:- start:419 stop:1156 length:738 start_codon:yes stop_codon:yes gene_type:complete
MMQVLTRIALTGLVLGVGFSHAAAQAPAGALSHTMYMQLGPGPGQLQAFEEARGRAIEHRREHGFAWNEFVAIDENNIVRISTTLPNGWADLAARRAWFLDTPRSNSGVFEVAGVLGTEIGEFLPEFSYQPENPRVAQGEGGFVREIRVYPSPGSFNQIQEFMSGFRQAMIDMDSDQNRGVARNIVGDGGFSLSVYYPATDPADYHAARQALLPIFDGLPSASIFQRIQNINWTPRQDLNFTVDN